MSTSTGRAAVLITGAGRGLGTAMAHRLAAEGYLVLAGARRPVPAGRGIVPIRLDVTDPASVAAAVATITPLVDGRGLFALVNNAAVLHASPLELAPSGIAVSVLTLGAFASDIRRNALHAWPPGNSYEPARRATAALVDMLDATAADPAGAADALVAILGAAEPPAHQTAGDGIDDLLALAAQPPAVRDAAITELFASVST